MLEQYRQLVEKLFPGNSFEERNVRHQCKEDLTNIAEWERHELRGVAQNEKIKAILATLVNSRVAYLESDLAMKWLPRRYR